MGHARKKGIEGVLKRWGGERGNMFVAKKNTLPVGSSKNFEVGLT